MHDLPTSPTSVKDSRFGCLIHRVARIIGIPSSQTLILQRRQAVCKALDSALGALLSQQDLERRCAAVSAVTGNDDSHATVSAFTAVEAFYASMEQSERIAHSALEGLHQRGWRGFSVQECDGHHVLKDQVTGLVHDLDCYVGHPSIYELRKAHTSLMIRDPMALLKRWPVQRGEAIASIDGGAGAMHTQIPQESQPELGVQSGPNQKLMRGC